MTDSRDDYWEDILDSVDMDVLPLEYINTVVVKFVDGKVWDIDINRSKDRTTDIENTLAVSYTHLTLPTTPYV